MTTPIKITQKIVSQKVADSSTSATPAPAIIAEPTIHDVPLMERPDVLRGKTYKIKPNEHAAYVTINDALFYEGTQREQYAPYEIFINTKDTRNAHHYAAITRLVSAVFRRGGDVRFLVQELDSIYDPSGGYWSDGVYMHSVYQEVGKLIHGHMKALLTENENRQKNLRVGLAPIETPTPHKAPHRVEPKETPAKSQGGTLCGGCGEYAVILMDGCPTCTACGAGKCG